MPSVVPSPNFEKLQSPSDTIIDGIMSNDPRWSYTHVAMDRADLVANFAFIDSGVLTRSGREGVPYMTTTGLYGPIPPNSQVTVDPACGTGVDIISKSYIGPTLIEDLENRFKTAIFDPNAMKAAHVHAKWVSVDDGGAIGGLSASSNVFGQTGQLMMKEPGVTFPVLMPNDPRYADTLSYYGGKLLDPSAPFGVGFDQPLFGFEYTQVLPDYIAGYAMQDFGGGGLFVEHHQFPHIWVPRKDTVSKILLGRFIEDSPAKDPQYHFTVFHVPNDGRALTIRPGTIHNDSYTQGPEIVFLAQKTANTVAIRKTAPFTDLVLQDIEPELLF